MGCISPVCVCVALTYVCVCVCHDCSFVPPGYMCSFITCNALVIVYVPSACISVCKVSHACLCKHVCVCIAFVTEFLFYFCLFVSYICPELSKYRILNDLNDLT